jgi:hypothetical protein
VVISIDYTDKIEKICTYCCPVCIVLPHPISEANWVRSGDNRTTNCSDQYGFLRPQQIACDRSNGRRLAKPCHTFSLRVREKSTIVGAYPATATQEECDYSQEDNRIQLIVAVLNESTVKCSI